MTLFASLVLEREPMQWAELPLACLYWVQSAGLAALIGLLFWCVSLSVARSRRQLSSVAAGSATRLSFLYLVLALCLGLIVVSAGMSLLGVDRRVGALSLANLLLTVAGGIALLTAAVPVARNLAGSLSGRRIWAIARLSMKEAIRGRVLWVFTIFALILLFAGFFTSYKPEDQIRNYVLIVYYATAPLFLLLAALLGSFSIPNDVTRQTIHTIVTKPVERYEIVLGRFLGYGILLSVALAAVTGVSLVYVARGVTREAEEESYKARVPVFGDGLTFWNTNDPHKGESVGREWDYRSYIRGRSVEGGGTAPRQYAIWSFDSVPAFLAQRTGGVPFEFTFDIFRMLKGDEGVSCTFTFSDGRLSVPQMEHAVRQLRDERDDRQSALAEEARKRRDQAKTREQNEDVDRFVREETQKLDEQLLAKYGVYVESDVKVIDYHTGKLEVPPALFKHINDNLGSRAAVAVPGEKLPALKVLVSVGDDRASRSQMVGVAKRDLYLLAAELPFWQNFFKGAIGLWLSVLLVLGLAVACSTYLSGIISLLATAFLFGAGMVVDYVRALAEGKVVGGGPVEAVNRILYHLPISAPLDQTPTTTLTRALDAFFRFILGTTLRIIPDVTRYNLTDYVANGFDIPWGQVLFLDNLVPFLAYLLPWAVLAYYLMNSREVANPT